ncbi:unnamed protein product [Chrysoparadoxa australica]
MRGALLAALAASARAQLFMEIDSSFEDSLVDARFPEGWSGLAAVPLVGEDDLPDIFACAVKSNANPPPTPPSGTPTLFSVPVLLKTTVNGNVTSFEDVTTQSGLENILCSSVVAADFDNDGDVDLFTALYAPDEAKECNFAANNGDGSFEVSQLPAEQCPSFAAGIAAADVDNDSYLDIFVTQFGAFPVANTGEAFTETMNVLLLGDGSGSFARAAGEGSDLLEAARFPCGASFSDLDSDGDQDLLVLGCNEILPGGVQPSPLYAFRNLLSNGSVTWEDATTELIIPDGPEQRFQEAHSNSSSPGAALGLWMGICFGDLNADGLLDVYVGNFGDTGLDRSITNHMPLIQQDGQYIDAYADLLEDAEILQSDDPNQVPFNWASVMMDSDNSGGPDELMTVGAVPMPGSTPNPGRIYAMGESSKLELLSSDSFGIGMGMSMAAADFNGDGRVDVAFIDRNQTLESPLRVFENTASNANGFLKVKLVDGSGDINGQGIGAKVVLVGMKTGPVARQVSAGTSNLSTNDHTLSFGLGQFNTAEESLTIEVQWPGSDSRESYELISDGANACADPVNTLVTIDYREGLLSCST